MPQIPSEKESTLKGKNLLPCGVNSFLLEEILFLFKNVNKTIFIDLPPLKVYKFSLKNHCILKDILKNSKYRDQTAQMHRQSACSVFAYDIIVPFYVIAQTSSKKQLLQQFYYKHSDRQTDRNFS